MAAGILSLLLLSSLPLFTPEGRFEVSASPDLGSMSYRNTGNEVFSFMGTAPELNGYVTEEDDWEGMPYTEMHDGSGTIRIRSKHDGTDLYILVMVNGNYDHQGEVFFEDDGIEPEGELDSENEDHKYVGSGTPPGIADAHWDEGWSVGGEFGSKNNGAVYYGDADGWSIEEWWIPLCTGDPEDINVTGNETLGFAWGWVRGWPITHHSPYSPEDWGSLHVIFDQAPTLIELLEPEDGFLGPGESAKVDFHGPCEKPEYSWDEGEWSDVPANGTMGLSGIGSGGHILHVRCIGRNNRTYEASFDITVDITPPDFEGIGSGTELDNYRGIRLSWEPAVDQISGVSYIVYSSVDSEDPGSLVEIHRTMDTSYIVKRFRSGTSIYFQVKAVDAAGNTDTNDKVLSIVPTYSLPRILDMDLDDVPARLYGEEVFAFQAGGIDFDGHMSPGDGWDEVPATVFNDSIWGEEVVLTIRAKHDTEKLYILFTCTNEQLPDHIYFEDDGGYPDRIMEGDHDDSKYVGVSGYPNGFRDAYWENGSSWIVSETQHGGAAGGIQRDGLYQAEWWLPLCTGDLEDINVTGDETLGFGAGWGWGWPDGVGPYSPSNWGLLHIIFSDYPGDISFYGPSDGSYVDRDESFGLMVAAKDPEVHYSLNGGPWMILSSPYEFNTNLLVEGENRLTFRFEADNIPVTEIDVIYYLDTTSPVVRVITPTQGETIYEDSEYTLQAEADDDVETVSFYIRGLGHGEYFIGEANYNAGTGYWTYDWWNSEHSDSAVQIFALAVDGSGNHAESTSVLVYLQRHPIIDDDDIVVDDDDIVVDDDDDDIVVADDDDDDDSQLLMTTILLILIILGFILIITAVTLAVVIAVKDSRTENKDEKTTDKTPPPPITKADGSWKMPQPEPKTYYGQATAGIKAAPAVPMMSEPVFVPVPEPEEPFEEEQDFRIEEEGSPTEEEGTGEEEEENWEDEFLYGDEEEAVEEREPDIEEDEPSSKKEPPQGHDSTSKYFREDGVRGGHLDH
ncbi:MAG: Ig-like domain-containing protein [Thermoplasmatota archaeon]